MKKGFTLVEIMIVVAIIGLLAAIAIPSFMRARTTSQKNACINNLRQIEAGKDQYALENGLTNFASLGTDTVGFGLLCPDYVKTFPNCPASTNLGAQTKSAGISADDYDLEIIGTNATCRIVTATHVLP